MSFKILHIHLGAQGMEEICEIWYCLVPFPLKCGPSRIVVITASNMVLLLLNSIPKIIPNGGDQKYWKFPSGPLLIVRFTPIFDMGDSLKESKGALFFIGKIMYIKIPF